LSEPVSAQELARLWVEAGAGTPILPPGADRLALAWALKDLSYEAWNTEPARAVRAAEAVRALVTPQSPELDALAAWTEGVAHATRGQMAESMRCFDAAGAAFRAAAMPDAAAQTQVPKIMALSMLGRHDEAAGCAERTQRELLALGNLAAAGRVSLNLGSLHLRRDAYAQAAPHYREASVLFARIRDHEHSVSADIGLADTLTALGDMDEALRVYARAGMRARSHGLELPLALVDESVALVELTRGHYRQALSGFESARRRYEALGIPQYLAIAEMQLGDAYLELRLLPEALALLDAAVGQFAELALPDEQARALAQRGRAQAWLGEREAAAASFAAAAALFAEQGNAVGAANVALARAELALAQGDAAAALDFARQSMPGFTGAGQAGGSARAEVQAAQALLALGRIDEAQAAFDTLLDHARSQQLLSVQVRCLTGQGQVALALGRTGAAREAFDDAIELFEDQRRALPGDEMRAAFLTDHLRPFEERLRMALAEGQGREVLLQLDRFRARALDERLAEAADLEGKRQRLNWLYRRVQRLHEEASASDVLSDELRRTERELLEGVRRQRLAAPQPAAAEFDGAFDDGFKVEALQAQLGERDALVEYGVQDDELFACIVTRHAVLLRRHLAAWPVVVDAVRALRFQIDALRHGALPMRQHLPMLTQRARHRAQQLHALIWAPLAPDLASFEQLLVVPHGVLGAVPFAALDDGQGPLGLRHALAVAPSARVALRGLGRRPRPARRALVLGESSQLAHAATEAGFVARLFGDAPARVGAAATLAALQQGTAEADVVHLACHALFRSDNPRFSALQMHDGPLTVDLAEALDLGPATVVLSACETGLADSGDEMVGLVRAFLVAGAARVLASLWPVDDEVTAGFMAHFYGALRAGNSAALSLRRAQEAVRADHPHPHFWGAFALYGGF
jgi:CHAT domain-containing protein/tetratricopeptide (TPR) repeat protein